MAELPAETREPLPSPPRPPVAVPRPVGARSPMSPVAAGLLAVAMAFSVLVPLGVTWVYPDLFPIAAPLVVLVGAVSLWAASRVDQLGLAAEVKRLTEDNAHLTQNLGWLSDTARELRESERALGEAREKAEAASRAKSRVLATVSHEFRTPLNGILGLTALLLETEQTPDQRTYARAVHSSGEALLALVDDMLDLSRIEADRLDLRPEPTDPSVLLQEIVELLAARAHGKGIDIAADVPPEVPTVMVDAHRLRQVLLNLAGNGVKFTDHGGVTLAVRAGGSLPGRVDMVFSVADTGPGIPQDAIGRLFREFEQLDPAPTRRHGGAGLGLAISRRIARAMGGDITLSARPGGGAVFSFFLSLPIAPHVTADALPDVALRSVLIVASDGAEPTVLAGELVAAGASARVTTSAYEAAALCGAAAAAGQPYDALLIDARLDAATALARMRDAAGGRVPAAVLIEPGRRGDVEALRANGFDAYLVRPVRRASLVRIVAEIVAATGDFRVDPGDVKPHRLPGPPRALTSLTVLLAEDNEINALLARAVLEGVGHTVQEVGDGAAAVAAATERSGRFDLILMDLHMPGIDGLAAIRAIRAHEAETGAPRTRILALTADVLAETRTAAIAAGVDQVVEKPMTPDALRKALAVLAEAA
jgi:signal transduction histidine kinase/CheY-like chemotaxis protein